MKFLIAFKETFSKKFKNSLNSWHFWLHPPVKPYNFLYKYIPFLGCHNARIMRCFRHLGFIYSQDPVFALQRMCVVTFCSLSPGGAVGNQAKLKVKKKTKEGTKPTNPNHFQVTDATVERMAIFHFRTQPASQQRSTSKTAQYYLRRKVLLLQPRLGRKCSFLKRNEPVFPRFRRWVASSSWKKGYMIW